MTVHVLRISDASHLKIPCHCQSLCNQLSQSERFQSNSASSRTHLSTVATLTILFFEVEVAEELLSSSVNESASTSLSTSQLINAWLVYTWLINTWLAQYQAMQLYKLLRNITGWVHACYFDLSLCLTNGPMGYTKGNFVQKLSDDDWYYEHCYIVVTPA